LDDLTLLHEYAARDSEAAFAELVSRRVGFVYSAALRQVRDPHLAGEITQAVFIILAQKAGRISDKTILAGWLFKTTRYAAIAQVRDREKRSMRLATIGKEFQMQSESQSAASDEIWNQMSPLLDEALATLGETDRQAVLLRFFENKSLAEIGSQLGTGEDTARKRVTRALDKLHRYFTKRGVSSTTAIIAGMISANSIQAAPVALAKTVTAVAIVKGGAASGSALILVKGALKLMTLAKAKTTALVSTAIVLAAGVTAIAVDESFWRMHLENLQTAAAVLIVRPTQYSDHMAMTDDKGRVIAHNLNFADLLEVAYGFSPQRMILPINIPSGEFELMLTLLDHQKEALQKVIRQQFGYTARNEMRETDVLLLKIKDPKLLAVHVSKSGSKMDFVETKGMRSWSDCPMTNVANYLERIFDKPVIMQSGLSSHYDMAFQWADAQSEKQTVFNELDQSGLLLVPTNMPVEMLVVEKVK
jgi:uncharacterized protein (TIGR03435 family)